MSTPVREILAANVRALIERVGSGAELARLTGVPQKTISRIANGENAANLDTLNDLAKGAGLLPWQLLVPMLDPAVSPRERLYAEAFVLLGRVQGLLDAAGFNHRKAVTQREAP